MKEDRENHFLLEMHLPQLREINSLRHACGEPPPSEREALSAPSLRELSAKLTEGVLKLWIVVKKSQLKTGCRFVKKSAARFIDFAVIYT